MGEQLMANKHQPETCRRPYKVYVKAIGPLQRPSSCGWWDDDRPTTTSVHRGTLVNPYSSGRMARTRPDTLPTANLTLQTCRTPPAVHLPYTPAVHRQSVHLPDTVLLPYTCRTDSAHWQTVHSEHRQPDPPYTVGTSVQTLPAVHSVQTCCTPPYVQTLDHRHRTTSVHQRTTGAGTDNHGLHPAVHCCTSVQTDRSGINLLKSLLKPAGYSQSVGCSPVVYLYASYGLPPVMAIPYSYE